MKITFVIKDVLCISYHHEVDMTSTVEKYISNDGSVKKWVHGNNDGSYCTKDLWYYRVFNQYTRKIDIYVNDELIKNINKNFGEIDSLCNHQHYNGLQIKFVKYLTAVREISDIECNEPIVDYLNHHDLLRACWFVNDQSVNRQFVDVKKSFSHYNCNGQIIFNGYLTHQKGCDINMCDLVTIWIHGDTEYAMKARHDLYNIRTNINMQATSEFASVVQKYSLRLPLISNRQTMIETFIQHRTDNHLTDDLIKLKSIDLTLYHVCLKYIYKKDFLVSIINDNDPIVLGFCCKNKNRINDDQIIHHKYMITYRLILSKDFSELFTFMLPDVLSDIIYEYVDFESKKPMLIDFEKTK